MTYQETFKAAQSQARDILRVQMAGRGQGRVSNAKSALIAAITLLAKQLAAWKADEASTAKGRAKHAEIHEATRAELAAMPDATDALEAFDKQMADDAIAKERHAEEVMKSRADETKCLEDQVSEARKEYERLLVVQQEVEDGTQKVNKDEMLALANKLVEEGRVVEDAE